MRHPGRYSYFGSSLYIGRSLARRRSFDPPPPPPLLLLGSDQIFEGKKPFCGTPTTEVVRLVCEGKTLDTPTLLKDQGLELEKIFKRCLQADHTARPNMEEVVAKLSS